MSCCCNTNPCSCVSAPVVCCTPTTESVEYFFENGNIVGIGFFDNETDNLVTLRGLVSDSLALVLTLDAPNKVLRLDFDSALLVADIPDADTTTRGILETATDGEALAKAATDKILTPSNLAAMGSTTLFAGLVELATSAETIAGTSTTLAVTPAGLAAAVALEGTTTFADAAGRAAAVAAFDGQFGSQIDTAAGFVADSTAAGDWHPMLTLGTTNDSLASTTLNMNGDTISLIGNGDLILANVTLDVDGATSKFQNSTTFFGITAGNPQIVDFANAVIHFQGAPLAAAGLIGYDATSVAQVLDLDTFVSDANTNAYTAPTGTLFRGAWATYTSPVITNPPTVAEVQAISDDLQTVSRVLAALLTDLSATLKPQF